MCSGLLDEFASQPEPAGEHLQLSLGARDLGLRLEHRKRRRRSELKPPLHFGGVGLQRRQPLLGSAEIQLQRCSCV